MVEEIKQDRQFLHIDCCFYLNYMIFTCALRDSPTRNQEMALRSLVPDSNFCSYSNSFAKIFSIVQGLWRLKTSPERTFFMENRFLSSVKASLWLSLQELRSGRRVILHNDYINDSIRTTSLRCSNFHIYGTILVRELLNFTVESRSNERIVKNQITEGSQEYC